MVGSRVVEQGCVESHLYSDWLRIRGYFSEKKLILNIFLFVINIDGCEWEYMVFIFALSEGGWGWIDALMASSPYLWGLFNLEEH